MANYFGEQRFGRQGYNLDKAWTMLTQGRRERDRHRRGLYLSAARSALFNQVLGWRIAQQTWNTILSGERAMLDGSQATFVVETPDAALHERARQLDIHPTGPLYGRGDSGVGAAVQALESEVLAAYAPWREGLENAGLSHQRRALRVRIGNLHWSLAEPGELALEFDLPRAPMRPSCSAN